MTRIILLLFSSLPILIFGQIELQAPDFEPSKLIEKSGVGFYPIGRTVEVPEIENYLISEKKQELTIKVNGAKGLNLYFNELLLAPGEELKAARL